MDHDVDAAPLVVRGRRRGREWTRVAHGLHHHRESGEPSDAALAAWQLLLPADGCLTGLTVAQVHGWWLPPLPADTPVFLAMARQEPRPMRAGVVTSRHPRPVPFELVRGLRCASGPEALLACARVVGLVDLVVILDSAVRTGGCTLEGVAALSGARRPGVRRLREAVSLADPRSESAWETLLRILHVVCDVPVEPQHELFDANGVLVARGDLRLVGTSTLHEYDGDEHESAPRRVRDLRRHRRLLDQAYVRRGYTSGDVLHRAATILRDADQALGRPHHPGRIKAWHALLRDSLFTPAGATAFRRKVGLEPGGGERRPGDR